MSTMHQGFFCAHRRIFVGHVWGTFQITLVENIKYMTSNVELIWTLYLLDGVQDMI